MIGSSRSSFSWMRADPGLDGALEIPVQILGGEQGAGTRGLGTCTCAIARPQRPGQPEVELGQGRERAILGRAQGQGALEVWDGAAGAAAVQEREAQVAEGLGQRRGVGAELGFPEANGVREMGNGVGRLFEIEQELAQHQVDAGRGGVARAVGALAQIELAPGREQGLLDAPELDERGGQAGLDVDDAGALGLERGLGGGQGFVVARRGQRVIPARGSRSGEVRQRLCQARMAGAASAAVDVGGALPRGLGGVALVPGQEEDAQADDARKLAATAGSMLRRSRHRSSPRERGGPSSHRSIRRWRFQVRAQARRAGRRS